MVRRLPRLIVAVTLLAACTEAPPTQPSAADGDSDRASLFTEVDPLLLTAEQTRALETIEARRAVATVRVARLSSSARSILESGKAVRLGAGLATGTLATSVAYVEREGIGSWMGRLPDGGTIDLVLTEVGATASLTVGLESYSIQPMGGGLHAIIRIDPTEQPSEVDDVMDVAELPPAVAAEHRAALNSMAADPPTWGVTKQGVLVLYTPAVASKVADVSGMIQLAVDQTNQAYSNSSMTALQVYRAGSSSISYSETGRSYEQHLYAMMEPSDGYMDGINNIRNSVKGDIVVLLVDDQNNGLCGIAFFMASAGTAFAVVNYECILDNNYSFAHEIGHLQGMRHERTNDPGTTPYAFGHGYASPTDQFRTIMATPSACGPVCPRIQYFSNTVVTYNGESMGTTQYEMNAQVGHYTRGILRDFRAPSPPTNVRHANAGVRNVQPQITWNSVYNAEFYYITRCVVNNGAMVPDWCWHSVMFGTPTTNLWTDAYGGYTQTGSTTSTSNCPRIALYRVQVYNYQGLSGYMNHTGVCVY